MSKTIEIIDCGRGPQLSTCGITVQDILPFLQRDCTPEEIIKRMPVLTLEEIQAVQRYVSENYEAVIRAAGLTLGRDSHGTNGIPEKQATAATREPFPAIGSAEWDAMNERRAELIRKDIDHGLTAAEREEYERLQKMSLDAVVKACPQPILDSEGLARLREELRSASLRRNE